MTSRAGVCGYYGYVFFSGGAESEYYGGLSEVGHIDVAAEYKK